MCSPTLSTARTANRQRPGWLARLRLWLALARERRQLARLDDTALSDLGLTRWQAEREARRPFWDGPDRR